MERTENRGGEPSRTDGTIDIGIDATTTITNHSGYHKLLAERTDETRPHGAQQACDGARNESARGHNEPAIQKGNKTS